MTAGRSPTNGLTVGKDLQKALCKLLYLRFCVSSDQRKNAVRPKYYWQFERYFYTSVIVIIIAKKIVTNSFLSPLFSLRKKQKNNQFFSKLVVWEQKIFLFPFIASHTLLQKHAEFNTLFRSMFLHVFCMNILMLISFTQSFT